MLRLLQGDVGSGKTVVALLAMATAVEAGAQAALMAPTELLARQHFATLTKLAAPAGLRVALLTGRERGRDRADILAALKDGGTDILIGTHALFQETIALPRPWPRGHRRAAPIRRAPAAGASGQRLAAGSELLVMTATPIPRTLLLAGYGDMDVSRLDEKPPGRRPVKTSAVPLDRLDEVVEGVAARGQSRRAGLLGLPACRRVRAARPCRR